MKKETENLEKVEEGFMMTTRTHMKGDTEIGNQAKIEINIIELMTQETERITGIEQDIEINMKNILIEEAIAQDKGEGVVEKEAKEEGTRMIEEGDIPTSHPLPMKEEGITRGENHRKEGISITTTESMMKNIEMSIQDKGTREKGKKIGEKSQGQGPEKKRDMTAEIVKKINIGMKNEKKESKSI